MNHQQSAALKSLSLLFLLPGLTGLILSAVTSTAYLQTLPRIPDPNQFRITPRNIDGLVVYETAGEDRKLTIMEDTSVGMLAIGLVLGLVYLRKWGISYALSAGDGNVLVQDTGE